ncbi:MAG: Asp-tRNA(Asn)/Glu-tRNA(Gln) amidotransferase subunit GatA [Thermodesulfobacteriota bacterium]|nr:Asp-tRNA(Asn)/Glu-tRNA(Gln) amidotransferase subunit GatA [Thermodesulfobacteriota bacterium]
MELYQYTLHELHRMLENGEVTSKDITMSVFKRIEEVEGYIGAFITLMKEKAIKQADIADKKIRKGEISTMTGIPLAIKDNICIEGVRTTCGSKMLENYLPPYDGTVIKRLKEKSPVFVGKTNMDEFAMGSSTEASYFGVTHNPWDIKRVPGGSSGGSASAVCADECIAALGSDTGGSIRQPAACCGIVGLKPTYGRVSRFGLVAFASSLDQIGPMTKDVRDCAILLSVISGYDRLDSTSVNNKSVDYESALTGDIKDTKIGIPKEYFEKGGFERSVEQAICDAKRELEKLGATFIEVSLPHCEFSIATYYLIAPSEASSNLARYDGVKYGYRTSNAKNLKAMYTQTRSEGFGQEVKRRIMLGTYALSAGYYDEYYKKASQVRTLIKRDFDTAFKQCDLILTPTIPNPAFKIGEKIKNPLQMYLFDVFTVPANLTGIPAISVPCGFSDEGMPIGLQLLARHFEEKMLLKVAYAFEQSTDHHIKRPDVRYFDRGLNKPNN